MTEKIKVTIKDMATFIDVEIESEAVRFEEFEKLSIVKTANKLIERSINKTT